MFSAGSYAKLWQIKEIKDKYSEVRISTSTKNKDGKYEQDFGGFVRMVGQAHEQMNYLQENDSFKIVRCGVSNKYDKEKQITYNNFVIFEVELSEQKAAEAEDDNPFIK